MIILHSAISLFILSFIPRIRSQSDETKIPPWIEVHPQNWVGLQFESSQSGISLEAINNRVKFSCVGYGTEPLNYIWTVNGRNIDQNSESFTLANDNRILSISEPFNNQCVYCQVKNKYGAARSNEACVKTKSFYVYSINDCVIIVFDRKYARRHLRVIAYDIFDFCWTTAGHNSAKPTCTKQPFKCFPNQSSLLESVFSITWYASHLATDMSSLSFKGDDISPVSPYTYRKINNKMLTISFARIETLGSLSNLNVDAEGTKLIFHCLTNVKQISFDLPAAVSYSRLILDKEQKSISISRLNNSYNGEYSCRDHSGQLNTSKVLTVNSYKRFNQVVFVKTSNLHDATQCRKSFMITWLCNLETLVGGGSKYLQIKDSLERDYIRRTTCQCIMSNTLVLRTFVITKSQVTDVQISVMGSHLIRQNTKEETNESLITEIHSNQLEDQYLKKHSTNQDNATSFISQSNNDPSTKSRSNNHPPTNSRSNNGPSTNSGSNNGPSNNFGSNNDPSTNSGPHSINSLLKELLFTDEHFKALCKMGCCISKVSSKHLENCNMKYSELIHFLLSVSNEKRKMNLNQIVDMLKLLNILMEQNPEQKELIIKILDNVMKYVDNRLLKDSNLQNLLMKTLNLACEKIESNTFLFTRSVKLARYETDRSGSNSIIVFRPDHNRILTYRESGEIGELGYSESLRMIVRVEASQRENILYRQMKINFFNSNEGQGHRRTAPNPVAALIVPGNSSVSRIVDHREMILVDFNSKKLVNLSSHKVECVTWSNLSLTWTPDHCTTEALSTTVVRCSCRPNSFITIMELDCPIRISPVFKVFTLQFINYLFSLLSMMTIALCLYCSWRNNRKHSAEMIGTARFNHLLALLYFFTGNLLAFMDRYFYENTFQCVSLRTGHYYFCVGAIFLVHNQILAPCIAFISSDNKSGNEVGTPGGRSVISATFLLSLMIPMFLFLLICVSQSGDWGFYDCVKDLESVESSIICAMKPTIFQNFLLAPLVGYHIFNLIVNLLALTQNRCHQSRLVQLFHYDKQSHVLITIVAFHLVSLTLWTVGFLQTSRDHALFHHLFETMFGLCTLLYCAQEIIFKRDNFRIIEESILPMCFAKVSSVAGGGMETANDEEIYDDIELEICEDVKDDMDEDYEVVEDIASIQKDDKEPDNADDKRNTNANEYYSEELYDAVDITLASDVTLSGAVGIQEKELPVWSATECVLKSGLDEEEG